MSLTWTSRLSVGNAVIDTDHKNLMAVAGGVERAILTGDRRIVPQAFELLEGWLCTHFANEEKIVRAAGSDLPGLRKAQQCSLDGLLCLRDDLMARRGTWSTSETKRAIQSLGSWMAGHIGADMPLKPLLQDLDHDLWPDKRKGEVNRAAGRTASPYLHLFEMPMPCTA